MITYPNLSRSGRIGNQLWQVAATIGIAASRGDKASFPRWDYQPYFNVPWDLFGGEDGTDASDCVPYMDERARPYLQDYRLIRDVEPLVRAYFQPSVLAETILHTHDWYRQLPRPRTVLHVRRGDNVTHPLGFHPLRTIGYYLRGLAELPDTSSIVVFSDDIAWCRQELPRVLKRDWDPQRLHFFDAGVARPREYVDRQRYESAPVLDWVDLCLMAEAEHHVISNSTYSWWGAFLSDDPAPIYPSNWFGWRVSAYTDASLMFPTNWREVYDETQGGVTPC